MEYLKRLALLISVIILTIFIMGCDSQSDTAENPKEGSKEAQIKKSFSKTLDMYPIRIHRNLVTTVFIGFGVPNGSLNYILSKILVVFLSSSLNFSSNK